jgi:hypothetical protein
MRLIQKYVGFVLTGLPKRLNGRSNGRPTKSTEVLTLKFLFSQSFLPKTPILGCHGVFKGNSSKADIRSLITKSADKVEQEKMLAHSIQLERQGKWTTWNDKVTPFDLS